MTRFRALTLFVSGCMLLISGPAVAAASLQNDTEALNKDGRFTISAGTELMSGDTTYQIGYPVTYPSGASYSGYFPFSELSWPLDIYLGKIEAAIGVSEKIHINVSFKKNLSDPDDNMEDRDWLYPGRLDVYSESSISDFDAMFFDADLEWSFLQDQRFSMYGGLGYMYQNFQYDGNLIRQYSPSGLPGFDFIGDGGVGITYEMTYYIPYVVVGVDFAASDALILSGRFALSPYVYSEDEDNHLLRENGGKISKGEMDGTGFFLDVQARYLFTDSLFVEAGISYTRIDVEGTQEQEYVLTGPLAEVAEEASSDQFSTFLNIGMTF